MPQVSFELSLQQVRELASRFGFQIDTVGGDARGDSLGFFGAGVEVMDAFIQRSIGTALELEAFQDGGGQLLARDRSGEVRELFVDLTRNGGTLRPVRGGVRP